MNDWPITAGAVLAALAVALGAFGAHALESTLASNGLEPAARQALLETWEVAVRYQMYHALGLLLCGCLARSPGTTRVKVRATCLLFLIGTAIFSGCLYAYVLTGQRILGAIVPIGGVAMIVGWCLLARK